MIQLELIFEDHFIIRWIQRACRWLKYLRGQRRFIDRGVVSKLVISDNGERFKRRLLIMYNAKHGIKKQFNLARGRLTGAMKQRKFWYLLTYIAEKYSLINQLETLDSEVSMKWWKHLKRIIMRFSSKWQQKYVDLRESHKIKAKTMQTKINVGNVVCIFEEGIKRRKWKKGKMLKLTKGKDVVVQGTDVQVFIHKLGRGIITRPYQNLYP